jgi:alpha-glucosidase
MINSKDSEPWAFGEEVEEVSRNYIGLRYRLLPYLYSTFHESARTGMPVARSLAIAHTHDSNIYDATFQNQYYFGHAFLIPPAESTQRFVKVYLPEDVWYDLHTGKEVAFGDIVAEVRNERFPIYVKGSSIIPMQSLIQSTAEKPDDVLEVHLYKGIHSSTFVYYEDDGVTRDNEKGFYLQREIKYHPVKNELNFSKAIGHFTSKFKKIKLYLHGLNDAGKVEVNGKAMTVLNEDYQFIKPVSSFDPFYKPSVNDMLNKNVPSILFQNTPNEIQINWS